MKKIAVLKGGMSAEREVSLKTGAAVAVSLSSAGYDVTEIDVGFDLPQKLLEAKPDIAFVALHGTYGEDGSVQGLLEFLKIPYTHSGVSSSALCMNKEFTQKVLAESGIKVAKNKFYEIEEVEDGIFPYPFVLKPVAEGSSVGVSIIKNMEDLAKAKAEWNFGRAMCEQFIEGRELSVTVLENPNPQALGTVELKPQTEFYDYKAKYTDGVTEHLVPAPLSPDEENKVKEIAIKAHKALGCSGVSRADFRYDGNEFYILEVNTHPGMTELSLTPEIAKYAGLSFADLLEILVNSAKIHNS